MKEFSMVGGYTEDLKKLSKLGGGRLLGTIWYMLSTAWTPLFTSEPTKRSNHHHSGYGYIGIIFKSHYKATGQGKAYETGTEQQ